MKKKIITATICLVLLLAIGVTYIIIQTSSSSTMSDRLFEARHLFEDDFENGLFWFDPDRHVVHNLFVRDSETTPSSFERFDAHFRNFSGQAIIIGEVAGPSINRILRPAEHLQHLADDPVVARFGINHVITPILVHHIIHLGSEVTCVKIGEIVKVMEGHYFATSETQEYIDGDAALGEIITNFSYMPMETGYRYVIYVNITNFWFYHFNGEPILDAMHLGMYRLDPNATPPESHWHPDYTQWWKDIMEKYGHLAEEIPWALMPLPGHSLFFNLGSTIDSPATPQSIPSIRIPVGDNIISFITNNHDHFTTPGLSDITRQGYEFEGWYMGDDFMTPLDFGTTMPNRHITLYARWKEK